MGDALTEKRRAIREAVGSANADSKRRVYLLPTDVISRVLDYQLEQRLPSEVAAVRELIDIGLKVKNG